MSRIHLIRHGQASLGLGSYDRLSELGRLQAERLGRDLCRRGISFAAVYTGTLERQRDTAGIIAEVYEEQSLPLPEPVIDPAFDEIDFHSIMREIAPKVQEEDPAFERLTVEMMEAFLEGDLRDRIRTFQRYYDTLFTAWVEDRYPGLGGTSWRDYCESVLATLDALGSHGLGRGLNIAAVTSGTPMGLFVARALDLGMEAMKKAAAILYNTNVTTFLLKEDDLVLESFNATSHLVEAERTRW